MALAIMSASLAAPTASIVAACPAAVNAPFARNSSQQASHSAQSGAVHTAAAHSSAATVVSSSTLERVHAEMYLRHASSLPGERGGGSHVAARSWS